MNGGEFLRRVRKLGRATGTPVRFDSLRGKGSHGTISYGRCSTVVKDRRKEIGKGLLRSMLADLGIDPKDF